MRFVLLNVHIHLSLQFWRVGVLLGGEQQIIFSVRMQLVQILSGEHVKIWKSSIITRTKKIASKQTKSVLSVKQSCFHLSGYTRAKITFGTKWWCFTACSCPPVGSAGVSDRCASVIMCCLQPPFRMVRMLLCLLISCKSHIISASNCCDLFSFSEVREVVGRLIWETGDEQSESEACTVYCTLLHAVFSSYCFSVSYCRYQSWSSQTDDGTSVGASRSG